MSRIPSSPGRRPMNRKRENANAALAEMNIDTPAETVPTISVLTNHRGKGPLRVSL